MINALARFDQLASAGRTPWHRASALAKLVLAAALIGLAVFAPGLRLLATLFLAAAALALSSGMPARVVLIAAGYPALFSGFFLAGAWDGSWQTPARILLRPLTASLTAAWLVGTTPYPDLFAPISRVLPRAVGDGLFLTYRALFDLMARAEGLWRGLRLRGGSSVPLRRRLMVAGEALATLVLYGFERGQRTYATMLLRGHSGRICGCRHYADWSPADALVGVALAVVAALAALLWNRA